VETLEKKGASAPWKVEDLLDGELGRVVRGAVGSVAREHDADIEELIPEVLSDLALRMLTGRFAGQDPRRARFETFLSKVARNCARDILRRRRRLAPVEPSELDVIAGRHGGPGSLPLDEVIREERRALLGEALESLGAEDPRGARILEARYLDGLPYEEIAREVGAGSAEAVHLWAHRARRSLLARLRRCGMEG